MHIRTLMAAKFSGAVKLGDLNDFIAPSQACVVKLNGGKVEQLSADAHTKVIMRFFWVCAYGSRAPFWHLSTVAKTGAAVSTL